MLVASQVVMYRSEMFFYGGVLFVLPEGGSHTLMSASLSKEAWEDMGSPETITAEVRPGDHLNEES